MPTLTQSRRVTILVVDDESPIRNLLKISLEQNNYVVITAADGEQALDIFAQCSPDLILLDVTMPKLDGWQVLREVRAQTDTPVCMLTGHAKEAELLAGFGLGADDYVTKPFSVQQVLARVKAILRRTGHVDHDQITVGTLALDFTARELRVGHRPVSLTGREFALLEVLVRNPNRVFTRAELLRRCWDVSYVGIDRVVDVHLASLRRKLGKNRRLIATVRGLGYKFVQLA